MAANSLPAKLTELLASGMTYKVIAGRAKCAGSTIFRIKNGDIDNPSYSVGSAIDFMHASLGNDDQQTQKPCTR